MRWVKTWRHTSLGRCLLIPQPHGKTYGNVTTEAMASGLAVVAYNYAAAKQHIQDGVDRRAGTAQEPRRLHRPGLPTARDAQAIAEYGAGARATVERLDWATSCIPWITPTAR